MTPENLPDIPLMKRQIEAQLDDYEREIESYQAFMEEWRAREKARNPVPDIIQVLG